MITKSIAPIDESNKKQEKKQMYLDEGNDWNSVKDFCCNGERRGYKDA